MTAIGITIPFKGLFNKEANKQEAWQPKFSDGLRHPFIFFLWNEMIYYKKANNGGLKHRFYEKVYNYFYTPEMQEENATKSRLHSLRSQALYYLNYIPDDDRDILNDKTRLAKFIEDNPAYTRNQLNGIDAEEIAERMMSERWDLQKDQYLRMML